MDEYKRRRRRSRAVMSMFLDSLGGSIDNVDIATFDSDGTDLKALVVGIDPSQDLHGYDSPWPAGGGKNKTPTQTVQLTTNTYSTLTVDDDGTESRDWVLSFDVSNVNVTAANASWFRFFDGGTSTDKTPSSFREVGSNTYWNNLSKPYTGRLYITYTGRLSSIRCFYESASYGKWSGGDITNIQLEIGTAPSSFAPYSNICPISGHSSVNVIVSPTLNPLDGTITNIPLGATVYGGHLDVLTGVLTDADAEIASYNGETINEPWISSMDAYSPGATPTTGAQVVYPLATPQTIQLTGRRITTFIGTNNVWCDSGKIIHLEY